MKNLRFIFVFIFFVCSKSYTQYQYHVVDETSPLYKKIRAFVFKDLRDTSGIGSISFKEANLLDSSNRDFGVFTFSKYSTEPTNYLYLKDYNSHNVSILEKYHIDSVMKFLSIYFNTNKEHITYLQRLSCTKRVIEILEARNYMSPYRNGAIIPNKGGKQNQ